MVQFSQIETLPGGDRKRVKLTADNGKRLVLIIRNCREWGIGKDNYGKNYQIPLVVGEKEDFLEKFAEIKSKCIEHLEEHAGLIDAKFKTHMYESENTGKITLYCGLPGGTSMCHASDRKKCLTMKTCPKDQQQVDIVIEIESVSWITGDPKSLSPKVTAREIVFLEEKGIEWENML